jgi:hypothetical protein
MFFEGVAPRFDSHGAEENVANDLSIILGD